MSAGTSFPMSSLPPMVWKNLPVCSLQQDQNISRQWDRLNACRGDLPFLSAYAVINALQSFGTGNERLLVGEQDSKVAAMFIFATPRKLLWETFQPSQIPLGAWVAESHLSLPVLVHSLIRGPIGFPLLISITQIDPLISSRSEDTANSQYSDYIETGWIDLKGSFEEYWNSRGKNLRQNMRKQRNRLAAEGHTVEMRSLTDPSDMAAATERYGALESAGWKGAQDTAIHYENLQGSFYRRLLESAAQRGEAIFYELLLDRRVIASNLCLQRQGTLFIMKTTYDESIPSYSPAFLLHYSLIESLYREKAIHRIEYYGRLMEWHTKWTENSRTLYHLTQYRSPQIKRFAEWFRASRLATYFRKAQA